MLVRWLEADSSNKLIDGFRNIAEELNIDITNKKPDYIINKIKAYLLVYGKEVIFVYNNVEKYEDISFISKLPQNVKVIITTRDSNLMRGESDVEFVKLSVFKHAEAEEYLKKKLSPVSKPTTENIDSLIIKFGSIPFKLSKIVGLINNDYISIPDFIQETNSNLFQSDIEALRESLLKKENGPEAWDLLQYISKLDPDFINIKIVVKLLKINTQKVKSLVKLLKSYSSISEIYNENGNLGLKVHREVQKEMKDFSENDSNSEKVILSKIIQSDILAALDELMPKVGSNAGNKWKEANLCFLHAKKILEQDIIFEELEDNVKLNLANLYHKMGSYYNRVLQNHQEALEFLDKALDIYEKLPRETQLNNIVKCLIQQGDLLEKLGGNENKKAGLNKCDEALNILDLNILENISSNEKQLIKAKILFTKGAIIKELPGNENSDLAFKYCEQSLKIRQENNAKAKDIIKSLTSLGELYWKKCDELKIKEGELIDKSEDYLKQALELARKMYPEKDHLEIAICLNNLGLLYSQKEDWNNTEKYYNDSINMRISMYGENNLYVAKAYNNLGTLFRDKNEGSDDLENALKYMNKSFDIYNRIEGSQSVNVGFAHHGIASVLMKFSDDKNLKEAVNHYNQAIEIYNKYEPDDYRCISHFMKNLGSIHKTLGNSDQAKETYNQLYALVLKLKGHDSEEAKELAEKISALEQMLVADAQKVALTQSEDQDADTNNNPLSVSNDHDEEIDPMTCAGLISNINEID